MLKFTPSNEDFNRIYFVLSALDPRCEKEVLRYALARADFLIALDGTVLHLARLKRALPAGLYEVKKLTQRRIEAERVETQLEFPDVMRLVPKKDAAQKVIPLSGDPSSDYTRLVRSLPEEVTVNYHLFESPALHSDELRVYGVAEEAFTEPVRFDGDGYLAVLSPCRLKDAEV